MNMLTEVCHLKDSYNVLLVSLKKGCLVLKHRAAIACRIKHACEIGLSLLVIAAQTLCI